MGKSQSVGILCEAIHVVTDKNKAAFGVNLRPVSKSGVVTGNIVTQKTWNQDRIVVVWRDLITES